MGKWLKQKSGGSEFMIGIRGQVLEGGQLVNLRLAVGQLNFSGGCRAQ